MAYYKILNYLNSGNYLKSHMPVCCFKCSIRGMAQGESFKIQETRGITAPFTDTETQHQNRPVVLGAVQ